MYELVNIKDPCFIDIILPLDKLILIFLYAVLKLPYDNGRLYFMVYSIFITIKVRIHIRICIVLNLLVQNNLLMGQPWGSKYGSLLLCGLHSQPVLLYTFYNLVVLPWTIPGSDGKELGAKHVSNMENFVHGREHTWFHKLIFPSSMIVIFHMISSVNRNNISLNWTISW